MNSDQQRVITCEKSCIQYCGYKLKIKPKAEPMEFRKLRLDDIEKINQYFKYSLSRSCDSTIGSAFMWRDYYSTEYAIHNSSCFFKVKLLNGQTAFTMPLGTDVKNNLDTIKNYCEYKNIPMIFCVATKEDVEVYGKYYNIDIIPTPDLNDYMYNASDLANFKGRKYNGQRNHINAFKRNNPNWSYDIINNDNIQDIIEFYKNSDLIDSKESEMFFEEQQKVFEVLQNYDMYKQIGGVLRSENGIVGFNIGEIIKDTLFVHIEKADTSIRGSYQMLVNQFAEMYARDGIDFINREDDVGDEGLRKSKLSYHPSEIIEKFTVVIK